METWLGWIPLLLLIRRAEGDPLMRFIKQMVAPASRSNCNLSLKWLNKSMGKLSRPRAAPASVHPSVRPCPDGMNDVCVEMNSAPVYDVIISALARAAVLE